MTVWKFSSLSTRLMSMALLACSFVATGCATSVRILPLVKSVKVDQGVVVVRVFPSPTPAMIDGHPIAKNAEFQMQPGQVLSVADEGQSCRYQLVKAVGDTAEFRQRTSTKQPDGHWQHDTVTVRVKRFVGLASDDQAQLPQQ